MSKRSNNKTPAKFQQARTMTPQERHRYIQSGFHAMAVQLKTFDKHDLAQRLLPNSDYVWRCSDLLLGKHALPQNQMSDACEAIRGKIRYDYWLNQDAGFYTEINFLDFTQKRCGDTFYLSDSVIYYRGMSEKVVTGHAFMEFFRLDCHVLIGDYNGTTCAFLESEGSDGKYHYAELAEFGMMSTVAVNGSNLGISTVFNKSRGIAHFEVMTDSPREKQPLRTDIPPGAKAPRNRGDCIHLSDEELVR